MLSTYVKRWAGGSIAVAGLISFLAVGPAFAAEIEHEGGKLPYMLKKGGVGEIAIVEMQDKVGILKAPPADTRRVYVYDPAAFDVVTKIFSIDGTTGRVLGEIDTGLLTNTVLSDTGDKIFLAETKYHRFSSGDRDDFIRCQDPQTLTTTCDFDIPEGRFLVMVMQQMADITTDGRYYLYYQFSPAPGVGVADLQNKKFLTTIDIPDCYEVFPSGPKSFVMHCRGGTLLNVSFDDSGKAQVEQTPRFRDPDEHIIDTPAFSRTAGKIFFVAYDGTVYPVDVSSGKAVAGKPWEMFTSAEREGGWGPGGWAPVAYHRESDRLFVLADARAEWTHVYASGNVLVYNASTGKRVDTITLNHAALTINVSQDSSPLLYALDNHESVLSIYDANSGRYRQSVHEVGLDPYIVVVPEK
jgi:methylamine dehydrogenase heavy chain